MQRSSCHAGPIGFWSESKGTAVYGHMTSQHAEQVEMDANKQNCCPLQLLCGSIFFLDHCNSTNTHKNSSMTFFFSPKVNP